jgi:hypothetical protein
MGTSAINDSFDIDSGNACMDANCVTVKAAASSTVANLKLAAGRYKVSLRGADATCNVYLSVGADNTATVAEPSDTANNGNASATAAGVMSMRGDEVERIYVTAANPWIAFILSSGATAAKIVFTKVAGGV